MLASIAFLPGTALGGWATWPLDMAKSYVTQGQAVTFVVPRSGASKLVESFRGVFTDAYVECPSAHRHEKFVVGLRFCCKKMMFFGGEMMMIYLSILRWILDSSVVVALRSFSPLTRTTTFMCLRRAHHLSVSGCRYTND